MNFLEYYRNNLAYIRSLGSEFAAEFPKIASRLELSAMECQDPYVERLLEGTAFLAARVEEKLESGFPRLLESVLSAVAPLALYPVPSYTILDLEPDFTDERLKNGITIQPGDEFHCKLNNIQTPCRFSAMGSKKLYPLTLTEASYVTAGLEEYALPGKNIKSALALKLDYHGTVNPDMTGGDNDLSIFLNLTDGEASLLQELMLADLQGIYLKKEDKFVKAPQDMCLSIPHFQEPHINSLKANTGLRKLQHYLIYPALYKFISLSRSGELFRSVKDGKIEIVFAFSRRESNFINALSRDNFKLWALPAVNLFRKTSGRSDFHGQFEQQVVPERTAPLDYEVFRIVSAKAFDDRNQEIVNYLPCYDPGCTPEDGVFIQHRRPRILNAQRTVRTSYPGSEVFISFAGKKHGEKWENIRQFQAETLCTNRDLPLLLRMSDPIQSFSVSGIRKVSFLTPPSPPGNALCGQGNREDWARIGYLALNFSSLLWNDGNIPLEMLKELIAAYSNRPEEETVRLLDGMISLHSAPKQFRFINRGSVFYESGWHCEITFREEAYAGFGVFTFGWVLKELLMSYTPLNSCMELVMHTDKKREVIVWKA